MESDRLVLERRRLPGSVQVGDEFEIVIKGRVRRIEAEHIDVTAYDPRGGRAFLEGYVFVEFNVMDVEVR